MFLYINMLFPSTSKQEETDFKLFRCTIVCGHWNTLIILFKILYVTYFLPKQQ